MTRTIRLIIRAVMRSPTKRGALLSIAALSIAAAIVPLVSGAALAECLQSRPAAAQASAQSAAAQSAAAQSGAVQSAAQPVRPSSQTVVTAVLVDAVVRDRQGRPVTDLTADDFEIYENGVRQALGAFTRVARGDGIGIGVGL
jgi:hypothetical protein